MSGLIFGQSYFRTSVQCPLVTLYSNIKQITVPIETHLILPFFVQYNVEYYVCLFVSNIDRCLIVLMSLHSDADMLFFHWHLQIKPTPSHSRETVLHQLMSSRHSLFRHSNIRNLNCVKVILCASEHICSIVRYCFRSFKQLWKDPLHVLTDANVLVLIDTDQNIFVNGRFSLTPDIHRPIIYA